MNYLLDVYVKIYGLVCSAESWFFFIMLVIFGCISIVAVQINEQKYKGQITYFIIVSLVSIFLFKILFYVFAPSPEFLGLVK